ncbi:MAG: septal ring lytic transglycosylase RlpA family protein [Pseudohongiellaceae bacterium]
MCLHLLRVARAASTLGLLLFLGACASVPTTSTNSRYVIQQDRAPTRSININEIPEVLPEPINRRLAGNRSPYTVLGKTYHVMATEEGYSERGVASWYGEKFHGHRTSNGEVFDMFQASAAHKSLPIPSFLQVTNLDNNRSLIVRVNDRGPFHGDRLIDLSYAAAVKLGFADRGTARVQLDAILPPTYANERAPAAPEQIVDQHASGMDQESYLQVGAFADLTAAEQLSFQLRRITELPVFIRSVASNSSQILHRVRVGPINDPGELQRLSDSVVAARLGSPYTVTE